MSSGTIGGTAELTPDGGDLGLRILAEGYSGSAWHGPDLKAALADVNPKVAFRRPANGRHSIAEIALHHAWCIRSVTGLISGDDQASFPLVGEDWFDVSDTGPLNWERITSELERQQRGLIHVVEAIRTGRARSPLSDSDRFGLLLGVTCHAIYHAGQVQLIKVLASTE
jgi:hypothetical protein